MDYKNYLIPAEREDSFKFKDTDLYMPRMAKAKTMLVGNKNSNVAICTSWDDPELVLTEEIIEKVAIAAPMRSTYGVNILLANLALNPQIDKLIFLRGGEFDETETGCLPRKIINNLWKNGIDKKGKIIGTELSLLPELIEGKGAEIIGEITKTVKVIDFEGKDEKGLEKLSKMIDGFKTASLKRKKHVFPNFKVEKVETLPSEKTAHEIREKTGALAWLKLIDRIIRYGQTAILETKEGTQVRELPYVRITIEDLEKSGFAVPDWLSAIPEVKITPEELEIYYQKFIKPDTYYKEIYPGVLKFVRPPTDKYLYCELLFAFPRPKEIDLAVEYMLKARGINAVYNFLSEKFPPENEKLAKNVLADKKITDEEKARVLLEIFRPPKNQVAELMKRLKEEGSDADKTLILWDPNVHSFLYSGRPCWVESAALLRDGVLNFKAVFRSHDIAKGWFKNVYGIYRFVQEYLCQPIGAKIGTITIESESGHIYVADLSWVKKLWQELVEKKRILPVELNDPRGNLLISVEGKEVEVVLISPEDGRPLISFKGDPQKVLKEIIQKDLLLQKGHFAYLGQELARAEHCIKNKTAYLQDKD
ncbi:hypothetical protein COS55_00120 [Candidatus Shapirobacteria bacterium CG03_land_8_20_14_0_80_40_19]|uniref:Uncharacterized protein n=3 Tax=Candidatus Shapironibacteriota TaxID=1752721 RepID=A0A2M7BGE6_9BACT|nr:MAG: hypothetical protein COV89_00500 [Candidatus Shapirobacteria bacterium CG11_big_fil_rev_8_21_14_0_20_40_12]PIV02202.1 MAG: hypothetical protein COS55_00120 [Candidatus Shapirobacteria bacterium CG03_land_8_20_14_0_80_40_19]PJC28593.1 MAG: hypothetical protein CO053_03795 [Candidatus Shapirobacteria bacterium CG_4_9_14_0_2_um_filter_40_11]